MSVLALLVVGALGGCGPTFRCPVGQQPLCQSGSTYGTRCFCETPSGLNH